MKCWQPPKGGFSIKRKINQLWNWKTTLSHRKSPGKENPWAVGTDRGKNSKEGKKRKEERVKSGKDQITQARRCMSLVEGCRPARQLGGRIQRTDGSQSWVDKRKYVKCRWTSGVLTPVTGRPGTSYSPASDFRNLYTGCIEGKYSWFQVSVAN